MVWVMGLWWVIVGGLVGAGLGQEAAPNATAEGTAALKSLGVRLLDGAAREVQKELTKATLGRQLAELGRRDPLAYGELRRFSLDSLAERAVAQQTLSARPRPSTGDPFLDLLAKYGIAVTVAKPAPAPDQARTVVNDVLRGVLRFAAPDLFDGPGGASGGRPSGVSGADAYRRRLAGRPAPRWLPQRSAQAQPRPAALAAPPRRPAPPPASLADLATFNFQGLAELDRLPTLREEEEEWIKPSFVQDNLSEEIKSEELPIYPEEEFDVDPFESEEAHEEVPFFTGDGTPFPLASLDEGAEERRWTVSTEAPTVGPQPYAHLLGALYRRRLIERPVRRKASAKAPQLSPPDEPSTPPPERRSQSTRRFLLAKAKERAAEARRSAAQKRAAEQRPKPQLRAPVQKPPPRSERKGGLKKLALPRRRQSSQRYERLRAEQRAGRGRGRQAEESSEEEEIRRVRAELVESIAAKKAQLAELHRILGARRRSRASAEERTLSLHTRSRTKARTQNNGIRLPGGLAEVSSLASA